MHTANHLVVVRELVQRGIARQEFFEVVTELTGLPPIQTMQLIACEQGCDIRDALGAPLARLCYLKTS